jgi:hypothetical protein
MAVNAPVCVVVTDRTENETTGLTNDNGRPIVCKMTVHHWSCECGCDIRKTSYIGPRDVCEHLRALDNTPVDKEVNQ